MAASLHQTAKSYFGLYLYLCGNQDTFNLWLSSADIQRALGISDSSYRRAVEDLLGEGYLIMRNGNPRTIQASSNQAIPDMNPDMAKRPQSIEINGFEACLFLQFLTPSLTKQRFRARQPPNP